MSVAGRNSFRQNFRSLRKVAKLDLDPFPYFLLSLFLSIVYEIKSKDKSKDSKPVISRMVKFRAAWSFPDQSEKAVLLGE